IPLSLTTRRTASTAVATPIGRLMKKIQCQLIDCVRMPPARRPTDPPAAATKLNTPIAFACSRGSGNIVTIMPRITAEVIAPPTPCTNRAATSISWLCATPHAIDASVKMPRPARNTPRREIRSPLRPATTSSPPKAIRYAFTTHARSDCEKPRSLWIEGSATFTTVASRTIISTPTHRTTSAVQRERSVCGAWVVTVLGSLRGRIAASGDRTGDRAGTHRSRSRNPVGWRLAMLIAFFEVPPDADDRFVEEWRRARDGGAGMTLHRALREDVDFRFVEVGRMDSAAAAAHPARYDVAHEDGAPDGAGGVVLIDAFEVPPGADDAFLAGWRAAHAALAAQPGYQGTRLHRAVAEADFRFVEIARWSSPLGFSRAVRRAAPSPLTFPSHPALYLGVRQ